MDGATTIWNRFGMEDLRFKAMMFFSSTTVFQVESHVDLPYHKIDKKILAAEVKFEQGPPTLTPGTSQGRALLGTLFENHSLV